MGDRPQRDVIDDGSEEQAGQRIVPELGQGETYAPTQSRDPLSDTRSMFHAFPLEAFCAFRCAIRWDGFIDHRD